MNDKLIDVEGPDELIEAACSLLGLRFNVSGDYSADIQKIKGIATKEVEYGELLVLIEIFSRVGSSLCILVEENHVDRSFRDTYYIHFASKHDTVGKCCQRISLFNTPISWSWFKNDKGQKKLQNHFVGSIVLRPLRLGKIGRTLLDPSKLNLNRCYIRTTRYSITLRGARLFVDAFPYATQDAETMTCAETTLFNLVDYFGTHFAEYRSILPSEIHDLAQKSRYDRVLPSAGLSAQLISKIFVHTGFSTKLYDIRGFNLGSIRNRQEQLRRLMHYHIESGIPVAVSFENHVAICIGHCEGSSYYAQIRHTTIIDSEAATTEPKKMYYVDSADYYSKYVMIDDNQPPYIQRHFLNLTSENGRMASAIIVPLYKRMFLEAEDAHRIAFDILRSKVLGANNIVRFMDGEFGLSEDQPIIYRFFLASSRSYKGHKVTNGQNRKVSSVYADIPLPRFLWICELYDSKENFGKSQSIGEIVLDATASKWGRHEATIVLNYPGCIVYRYPDESADRLIDDLSGARRPKTKWTYASGYSHNLTTCPTEGE